MASRCVKVAFVSCVLLLSVYLFGSYIYGKGMITNVYDFSPNGYLKSRATYYDVYTTDNSKLSYNDSSVIQKYYGNMFIFHACKDSIGGDLFHVEGLSIDQLKVLCYQSVGCVGFTTNGHLKRVIQPYNKWTDYIEEDMSQGLFTLDTNYCVLDEGHNCPVGATCLHEFNGTYTCDSIIHIGMSVDSKAVDGLVAVLQSIIEHSSKNQIIIHIITNTTDEALVKDRVNCSIDLPPSFMIDYIVFDIPDSLRSLITVGHNVKHLGSNANYARFYLAELLPNVSYLIYLDADIVVKTDIKMLWKEIVNTDKLLVITPSGNKKCDINYTKVKRLFNERYKMELDKKKCIQFNAGVFGINLKMWRDNNMLEEVKYWMKEHKSKNLWSLVTQPIMYIISYGNQKAISSDKWNWQLRQSCSCKVRNANIVHWNGEDKPWYNRPRTTKLNRDMRRYDKLWNKYRRDVCSNNGLCTRDADIEKSTAYCVCNNGYTGRLCNMKL